ncbi:hypothetical protein N9W84_00310 [bacterium]|nr:hypothetical protein [bacterium]
MSRLRWKLCKIWGCGLSDERFDNLNNAQILWYSEMFALDRKDNFELLRDFVEYNASFMNPESVSKIRNMRDTDGNINSSDNIEDRESTKKIFEDPLVAEIGKKIKKTKGTNNQGLNEPLSNIESPLYKIIRDE